jgi:hypothetical protein
MKSRRLERIILYDEDVSDKLQIREIAEYLRGKLSEVQVESRGTPFASCPDKSSDFARKLASIKIQDIQREVVSENNPLYGEIQFEKRRIMGETRGFGVLYDGFHLQRIFSELIPQMERNLGFVHIFLTNRLFATWDENDKRYHLRTSVYGVCSIISTTGLVEAPARPKEYYLLKNQYEMLGRDPLELKDRFKGRFIDYDDERLTEVAKGYVMQAFFYTLTGNPFCEDRGCRLYNAHWQEELIFAQLESEYEFCQRHREFLSDAFEKCKFQEVKKVI